MKKIKYSIIVALPVLVLLMACPDPQNNSGNPGKKDSLVTAVRPDSVAPMPSGFNYPVSQERISGWVKNNQLDSIRYHGWNLWVAINQPAPGIPDKVVWQTWYSVSETFQLPKDRVYAKPPAPLKKIREKQMIANMVNATRDPASCTVVPVYDNVHNPHIANIGADDGFLANNGDIMMAGVYYNWEAYNHIRTNNLYLQSALASAKKNPGQAPGGNIPEFPSGAITLKHMLWPVKQDGYSALPVWDDNPPCSDVNYNGYESWTRAVAIDPSNEVAQKTANVSYLYGVGDGPASGDTMPVRNFSDAKVVPINQFYYWQISAEQWAKMTSTDQAIINNSFWWAYNRAFQPGDYVVSLAMHIITKEYYDWTMQSFWWHDQPEDGPYSANKPTNLPAGVWSNYEMTTAYSMVNQSGSSLTAYNPYIELVVPEQNRLLSNCQNCHTRGAWPEGKNVIIDPIGGNLPADFGSHYNSSQTGQINPTDSLFMNLVRTDFSWAIPDRAYYDMSPKGN